MRKTFKVVTQLLAGLILIQSSTALAAEGGLASSRTFLVSAPMTVLGNELGARMEFNAYDIGSIALDGIIVSKAEEFDQKKSEEANASLISKGYEAALTFSRFTRPNMMAGFYWSLGGGYRVLDVLWSRAPSEEYALNNSYELDKEGRITHHLDAAGTTLRGRLGYRYVPDSLPFVMGLYAGLRHYEPKITDAKTEDGEPENPPTTDEDRYHLKKQFMTKLEGGVELGFSF